MTTCRASDKCSKEKRKTINGDDLLWAMSALGFEEYVEPLKMYLHKYREVQQGPAAREQLCYDTYPYFVSWDTAGRKGLTSKTRSRRERRQERGVTVAILDVPSKCLYFSNYVVKLHTAVHKTHAILTYAEHATGSASRNDALWRIATTVAML